MIPLPVLEEITDRSGIAPRIELLLPTGVRARQLAVRTLLLGMLIVLADHRPAHLTRVHQALTTLPEDDQRRLGVIADWKHGPHQLTYRQTERTFGLVADALAKDIPDGLPSQTLTAICDDLLEASIPDEFKDASTSLAVDWTDLETFSRPAVPRHQRLRRPRSLLGTPLRRRPRPGQRAVLRLLPLRRHHDARGARPARPRAGPADDRLLLPPRPGPRPGPGAHRDARRRHPPRRHPGRLRLRPPRRRRLGRPAARQSGAELVQDLHPSDRGPRGTHHGAIIANGNLYCPATPTTLLELAPLARDATPDQAAAHDQQTAETARHKLGKITSDDADGYHRVMCPAVMGKIRCPLRPASMTLDRNRPEILTPPGAPAGLLHPADHHRAARTWPPRPGRNTTTPQPRTASPTPAAPAPSGPSPPPRTPPPTTSPAAGPGSRA